MRPVKAGGGWASIRYALSAARRSGGLIAFYKAMRSRNACKTCALGMGGQQGGMVNESGSFPEVCKKSIQAMAADMQGRIPREFFERFDIAAMQRLTPRELEHLGRLAEPMHAGPGDAHFHPISWDEALSRCAVQLRSSPPDAHYFYCSGRSSNEAGFLLNLFARLYGTNQVSNCSYYCHQASGVGLTDALGTGTATLALEDVEHCDLLVLIGANPSSNHPRMMSQLMRLRRRGGRVLVINPLVEPGLVRFRVPSDLRSLLFGTRIASLYVQPHCGGDAALLVGLAKRIDEMGAVDESFVAAHTEGFDALRTSLRSADWALIERSSGVDRAIIDAAARMVAESQATVFAWTMGITHHAHGVENVRAIANLALMRGMVGRPHAGLLPIRGHSNVQGIGSVGVTPMLRQAVFDRLEAHFGVSLPRNPGLDPLAAIDAMRDGRLRSAWCVGGNLFGASPDAQRTAEAFRRLDFVVYVTTTLNTGHAWGRAAETLLLPAAARDEEPQPTTQESMFNYVRLSEGGPSRIDAARSEVEIIASIAERVLDRAGPVDWAALRDHRNIRRAIAAIVPGYEDIGRIDETRREFHVAGRLLHAPKFPTESGRARFHVTTLPQRPCEPDELLLTTLRSEGQFNTVVYEDFDLYRGIDRRDVVLMAETDMQRLGLQPDQPVTVRSAAGAMHGVRVRPYAIRPGNVAMYYPEANVLVPTAADPSSRTPAYKSVAVRIEPDPAARPVERRVPEPSFAHREVVRETRAC
ncbi:MAG: FdhF/YdeP family oxidoreductase [Phycisphaerae bacterium]|nr:FdhF/YdeP family oxidoreductase [Phycisphaerae bacterium]